MRDGDRPGHHDRHVPDLANDVIARLGELGELARVLPGAGEDLLDLEGVDVGIRIPAGRERHVPRERLLDRLRVDAKVVERLRRHANPPFPQLWGRAAKSRKSWGVEGNADFASLMRQTHHAVRRVMHLTHNAA
jgi:hypothetical protein